MARINLQDGEIARLQITKEQEVEISKLYHKVYLNLKKQMDSLPLQGEGTISQSLKKTYLNKLIKQLKAEYKSLGEGLEKQIKKGMKDVSSSVVQANDDWLQKVGIKIEGAYSFVPRDIVALVSTGKLYGGGWTLSKAIWGESQKHAHDIDTIVASGIAANKSAYDISKDLEKYVNPSARKEWDWSKVYPGTSKKVDYNAQRLARTMVSHAYQQSLLASTKYNPFVKGYRWRSAHSDRTCELCNDRDGQLYSAHDLPLDHPNGMCTFIAELTGDLESIADRLGDWANGADDPALDEWAKSMYPPKKEYQFTKLQQEWLGAAGFSPTNMPQNFKAFANGLTFDKQTELLKLAGTDWSNSHPYQAMEKWYNSNILSSPSQKVKDSIIKSNHTKTKTSSKSVVSTFKDWMSKIRENTESKMLDWESRGLMKLPQSQIKALREYTGSSYTEMNSYLRYVGSGVSREEAIRKSGISSPQLEAIKGAMKGLNSLKTTESLYLRRGTDLGDLAGLLPGSFHDNLDKLANMSVGELNQELSGVVGTYHGFTSTSSLYDRGFNGDVEIIFHAPAGTSASSIMKISKFGTGEGETLLNAGTTVRVASVEKSDGHKDSKIRVFMEIIP